MRLIHQGSGQRNEAFPIVREYFMRKSLNGLGYSADMSRLSSEKAEWFQVIVNETETIKVEEMKRAKSRAKHG